MALMVWLTLKNFYQIIGMTERTSERLKNTSVENDDRIDDCSD